MFRDTNYHITCVFAIVFVMVHPCAHHSTGVVFIRCSEPGVWSTLTWCHHILTLKRSSSYFKQRTPTEGMHLNRMWTYCVSAFSDTPRGCNVGQNVGDCDRRILDSICMGVCVCPSNGLIMGWFARVWWCVMHHANSGLLAISCCLSNVWLCFASAFSRLSHHSHPSNNWRSAFACVVLRVQAPCITQIVFAVKATNDQ